jgi:hypothetical protein
MREPKFLYVRRVNASSRPVTGISGGEIYQPLDGQVTIDLWDEDATGWAVRCPRSGCGTERTFDAYALRQLVAGAGVKLFITLPAPTAPER